MNNNLRDFANNFDSHNQKSEKDYKVYEEQAKNLISKYQNMSSSELASTLLSEVAKQKANGTFSREQLLNMLDSIKFMLKDESQYMQLKQVIQNL